MDSRTQRHASPSYRPYNSHKRPRAQGSKLTAIVLDAHYVARPNIRTDSHYLHRRDHAPESQATYGGHP